MDGLGDLGDSGLTPVPADDTVLGYPAGALEASRTKKFQLHDVTGILGGLGAGPDDHRMIESSSLPPGRIFTKSMKGAFDGRRPRLADLVGGHQASLGIVLAGVEELHLPIVGTDIVGTERPRMVERRAVFEKQLARRVDRAELVVDIKRSLHTIPDMRPVLFPVAIADCNPAFSWPWKRPACRALSRSPATSRYRSKSSAPLPERLGPRHT